MNANATGKAILSEEQRRYLLALTDEEIEAAAQDDTDDYLPTDEELKQGKMMPPVQQPIMITLPIDAFTVQWFEEHRIDVVPAVQKMLHHFIEVHGAR